MDNLHKNVILDLLPAYITGDASEETKRVIEEYAKNDPQIEKMIKMGKIELEELSSKSNLPDDLEMKTLKRVRQSIRKQMLYVSLATATILLIPFAAMQYSNEVNWSVFDFLIMGILLSGTGLAYVLITRMSDKISYRFAVGIAVLTGFLIIWVNLAVGIIGAEDNPANLLYLGIYIIGIIGAAVSRLHAKGMAITLFLIAGFQMIIPLIVALFWRSTLDEPPGIIGVIFFNTFFSFLFAVSGIFFHLADKRNDGNKF